MYNHHGRLYRSSHADHQHGFGSLINQSSTSIPDHEEDDPDHQQVPKFEWDKDLHESFNGRNEKLTITFPEGRPDDHAFLSHGNPIEKTDNEVDSEPVDGCIYKGNLLHESDVVTVVECLITDSFEVKSFEL